MKNADVDKHVYIELTLTNSCNCNCSYCFEGCHHESVVSNPAIEQQQLKFITDFCKSFDNSKFDQFGIGFWGGEPFMNTKFMYELINATCQYDFVRYHCYTNGTLINQYKDFLNQLFIKSIRNRINLQLSYDGEPQNTIKRGYSKDIELEAADLFYEARIPFVFKATLSYDMIPYLDQIWKSYEELFYRYPNAYIRYIPTLDTSTSDITMLNTWQEKLLDIAKLEYQFIQKNGFALFDWFNSLDKKACKLKNVCMIHTDGNIYPCHGVPYLSNNKVKDNLTYGNIYNNTLADIIANTVESNVISDECAKCNAKYCAVCHVSNIRENDQLLDGWINRRSINKDRCSYFQTFSYISDLLRFAILKSQVNNCQ